MAEPTPDRVRMAIKEAAQAHTDLNIFHAVIGILEGGVLYTRGSRAAAERIIDICKSEAGKRLRDYDTNVARVERARRADWEENQGAETEHG
jgi:hypothetical protein